jgi:hypothetical protein
LLVSFLWLLQVIAEKCNAFTRHAVPAGQVPALQAGLGGGELMGDHGKFYPFQKYKILL